MIKDKMHVYIIYINNLTIGEDKHL